MSGLIYVRGKKIRFVYVGGKKEKNLSSLQKRKNVNRHPGTK